MSRKVDEVLDELDAEVPAVADVFFYRQKGQAVPKMTIRDDYEEGFEDADELYRAEDVREALQSAVQHGREQERRRIQENYLAELKSELHFILAHSNLEKSLQTRLEDLIFAVEELEEEVSESEKRISEEYEGLSGDEVVDKVREKNKVNSNEEEVGGLE